MKKNSALLLSYPTFIDKKYSAYTGNLILFACEIPAVILGIIFMGIPALLTFSVAFFTYLAIELVYLLCLKKELMLGIVKALPMAALLGMIMSPDIPLYFPALVALFVVFIKAVFGGDNGMLVNKIVISLIIGISVFGSGIFDNTFLLDGQTMSTPLQIYEQGGEFAYSIKDLLLGNVAGLIGSTSILALLIGGIVACFFKVIDYKVPLFSGVSFVLAVILMQGVDYVIPELCSGAVILTFVFLATDYYTCPNTGINSIVYACSLGVISACFKMYLGLGEFAVFYSLIFCNLVVAIIDKRRPKYFGEGVKHE